jgi:hypothetical protein
LTSFGTPTKTPVSTVPGLITFTRIPGITLDAGDVTADFLHGMIQLLLTSAGDKHVSTLLDEQLGGGQCHPRRRSGYYRDLSFQLLGHLPFSRGFVRSHIG